MEEDLISFFQDQGDKNWMLWRRFAWDEEWSQELEAMANQKEIMNSLSKNPRFPCPVVGSQLQGSRCQGN